MPGNKEKRADDPGAEVVRPWDGWKQGLHNWLLLQQDSVPLMGVPSYVNQEPPEDVRT